MQNVEVVHNFFIQAKFQNSGAVVWFKGHPTNAGNLYISLESVEISSNVFIYHTCNQELYDIAISALSVEICKVHFKQTTFSDNSICLHCIVIMVTCISMESMYSETTQEDTVEVHLSSE